MKKTYVVCSENGYELSRYTGEETYSLYVGIDAIDGGWLLESGGDGITKVALEEGTFGVDKDSENKCVNALKQINAIIADPSTPWEELNEIDAEYILDTLDAWGIKDCLSDADVAYIRARMEDADI